MPRRLIAPILTASLLLVTASLASAQAVRGQVVDSVSGSPVGNGFVVLLGGDRKEVARTLTDAEGRFWLTAPTAGTYRLRSERIAFRATVSAPLTVTPDGIAGYRLLVSALPVRLAAIGITGDDRCVSLSTHRAAQEVWEEARKALTATAWSQGQSRLSVDLRTYERDLSPSLKVEREMARRLSGVANKPFTSPPPADLARNGYIQPTRDGGLVFYAPDADVLFSDQFLDQHCFRLAASKDSASLIGLAFEPIRKRGRPDIAGVMWLDRSSAELKHIEYWYTDHGLPSVKKEAGGLVQFQPLTEGYWVVSRWWIRMPVIVAATRPRSPSLTRFPQLETFPELAGYKEDGGELLQASSGGQLLMAAGAGRTLFGRVVGTDKFPMRGAVVRLAGTSFAAASGADGEFQISGVPEGIYSLTYTHPIVPNVGPLPVPGVNVSFAAGRDTTIQLVVPSIVDLLGQICPGRNAIAGHAALAGVAAREEDGSPIEGLLVRVRVPSWTIVPESVGKLRFIDNWRGVEASSNGTGHYLACDLPPEQYAVISTIWRGVELNLAALHVLADSIHQRDIRTLGDSVFVR